MSSPLTAHRTAAAAALALGISVAAFPHTLPAQVAGMAGTLVVTNKAPSTATIIDVATGRTLATLPTGHGPHEVAMSGDGRVAVVTDYGAQGAGGNIGSNTVSELNGRTGEFVRSFDVPAQPEAINVTADGMEVWVGSNATGRVSVLDPRAGTVTTAAEGLGWPYRVLFTPDRRLVMLPDLRNEELRFLDRASRRELGRLTFPGGGPQGIAIAPDGRHVFQSLSQQGRVAVIDVDTRAVVGYLRVGETPDGVAYSTRLTTRSAR